MPNIPRMEDAPVDALAGRRMPAAPLSGVTEIHQGSDRDGQWIEVPECFRFTFAGLFLGAVSFRCLTLRRPLGQPPYPLDPSLLDLLPEGVRALHIGSQAISAQLPRVWRLGRGICYVPLQGKRFFIDLNRSFEAYLAKFSGKSRTEMRRNVRRFARACTGSALWREFRDATGVADFHSLASEVSRKTYQHRLLRSGIDTSPSFREELIHSAIMGHLRGYILFHQQTPIAFMLCRARGGDLVFEKGGFDPSFAEHSPGFVLLWFALQRLFSDSEFRRLDFGEGAYPYKEYLATGSLEVAEIYCFPWHWRNAALVVVHSAVAGAANLLRSVLEILGVAQRLKKMTRHGIGGVRKRRE